MSFSISWTDRYPWWKKLLGYLRIARARRRYGNVLRFGIGTLKSGKLLKKAGYQDLLHRLRNVHEGVPCFVLDGSASVREADLSFLENEIIIASGDMYKLHRGTASRVSYYTCTDSAFLEGNVRELRKLRRAIKIFGLGNSYCTPVDARTLFVNEHRPHRGDRMFSGDIAAVAYIGESPAYLNLQLAFHLGCDPVYVVGT